MIHARIASCARSFCANWIGPALICGTLLTSCASMNSHPPVEQQPVAVNVLELESGSSRADPQPAVISTQSTDAAATVTLTLDEAIALALEQNPELHAAFAEYQARLEKIPQVRALPDPMTDLRYYIERPQSRTGEMIGMAGVSQQLPWFGKRTLRSRFAEQDAAVALEDFEARMLDVMQETGKAWHELEYQRAAQQLAVEQRQYARQSLEAATAAYAGGKQGRQGVLKAQFEFSRVENELLDFPAQIAAQEAALRRLLNRGTGQAFVLAADRDTSPLQLNQTDLFAIALRQRPELRRVEAQLEQSRLQRKLAQKDYWPDPSLGVEYNIVGQRPDGENPEGEGDDDIGVSLSFALPLRNARRRAQLAEAERKEQQALHERAALELRIRTDLDSILSRLHSLAARRGVFENSLLPLAAEAFDSSQAEYVANSGLFLDLLDAQRTLLESRRAYLETLRDYNLAWTELERATGSRIRNTTKADHASASTSEQK